MVVARAMAMANTMVIMSSKIEEMIVATAPIAIAMITIATAVMVPPL